MDVVGNDEVCSKQEWDGKIADGDGVGEADSLCLVGRCARHDVLRPLISGCSLV